MTDWRDLHAIVNSTDWTAVSAQFQAFARQVQEVFADAGRDLTAALLEYEQERIAYEKQCRRHLGFDDDGHAPPWVKDVRDSMVDNFGTGNGIQ